MLKGHVFKEQIFEHQVFAYFIDTFLDKKCGVGNYGNNMAVTHSGNNVTIQDGLVCIRGRFIEEDTQTTISAGTDNSYCKLVIEIDLDKENTEEVLKQVSYKIIKNASSYPSLVQTDIVKNNAGIYQYELARFRNNASGITSFQDMRTFIDLDSILNQMNNRFESFLSEFRTKITNVENGSAYLMKSNVEFIEQVADSTNSCVVNYPSGFNVENTIILSIQCGINNTMWKDYFSKVTSLNYGKNNILINFSENISNIVRVILMKIPGC